MWGAGCVGGRNGPAAPQHPNHDSPGEPSPQWNRNRELTYRCKIFLFVNADLLNLFPQIPKPITLCILQKGLFFVMFLLFGLFFFVFFFFLFLPNIRYYYTEQKKTCRTNTGRMLEYCTREEKYSRNNFIQLFIKRKIYTIDLFCKIKIHHAIYITSSELYYWIYQQFTVHFNCAHEKKLHFF